MLHGLDVGKNGAPLYGLAGAQMHMPFAGAGRQRFEDETFAPVRIGGGLELAEAGETPPAIGVALYRQHDDARKFRQAGIGIGGTQGKYGANITLPRKAAPGMKALRQGTARKALERGAGTGRPHRLPTKQG